MSKQKIIEELQVEKLILEKRNNELNNKVNALKRQLTLYELEIDRLQNELEIKKSNDRIQSTTGIDIKLLETLKISVKNLGLSTRAERVLLTADCDTLGDVVMLELSDLSKCRNIGKMTIQEITELLDSYNLHFGMKLNPLIIDYIHS